MSTENNTPPIAVVSSRAIHVNLDIPITVATPAAPTAAGSGAAAEPESKLDMRSPNKSNNYVVSPPRVPLTPNRVNIEAALASFGEETPKPNEEAECCLYCGGACFTFSILIGLLILTGFNIYALSLQSNKTVNHNCKSSYLWEWMISWLCVNAYLALVLKTAKGDSFTEKMGRFLCQSVVAIALLVWGAVECWGRDCVDTSLLLYTLSEVTICFYFVMYGIIYTVSICIMCEFIGKE